MPTELHLASGKSIFVKEDYDSVRETIDGVQPQLTDVNGDRRITVNPDQVLYFVDAGDNPVAAG